MDEKIKLLRKGERIALLSSLISFLLAILKPAIVWNKKFELVFNKILNKLNI